MKTANRTKRTSREPNISTDSAGATFAATDAAPIDAPMWPHCAPSWLQPESSPSLPVWTGLAIERRFAIPAPDFIASENAPMNLPAAFSLRDEIRSHALPKLPTSDLAPLGWDPRAICRKGTA